MAIVQSFASFFTSLSTQEEAGGGPATRSSLHSGLPPNVKAEVKTEEEGYDEQRMLEGETVVVKRGRGRPRGSTKQKKIDEKKAPPSPGLPLLKKRSWDDVCVWPSGVVPLVRRVRLQFPCSVGFIYLLTQACTNDEGVFEKVKQLAQSKDVLGQKTRVKKVVLDKYPGQWA